MKKPTKKEVEKYSYLCNDLGFKCSGIKWKKVKHKHSKKTTYGGGNEGNNDFESKTKNLLDVKVILDDLKIPFFLTHGALLGAYRDKDWIKWDDDTELDIFDDIFQYHYNEICCKFMEDGFIVRGRAIKSKGKQGEKINIYRYRESISVRGVYLDPNYEQGKYRLTNVFQYLKKFYENPEEIEFKGVTFLAPGPIEDFLEYRYGKSWKTPINVYTSKKAKKKDFEILYKRGVRRPGV